MEIRKLRKNDHAAIMQIARQLSQWFTKDGRRQIRYAIRRQPGFVAIHQGSCIGFLTYRSWKRIATITWTGVNPSFRRKGIGTKLLHAFEREIKNEGISEIHVSTLSRKARYKPYLETVKFYEALGYKTLRIDKNFYPQGGDREVLIKKLR